MVKHLLSLIRQRRVPPRVDGEDTDRRNSRIVNSVTQRLTRLLNPPIHSNLSSSASTPFSSSHRRAENHTITPEQNDAVSPVRRRKNQPSNHVTATTSPRKGVDAKRQRFSSSSERETSNNKPLTPHDAIVEEWEHHSRIGFGFAGKPTTEFDGWRRLWTKEICRISPGTFVLICIPPWRKRYPDDNIIRERVMNKITEAVKRSCVVPFDHKSSFQRQVTSIIQERNAIMRNGVTHAAQVDET